MPTIALNAPANPALNLTGLRPQVNATTLDPWEGEWKKSPHWLDSSQLTQSGL
jgi:hypothetical protein